MYFYAKKLKVVIIDNPINYLDEKEISTLWGKILCMKKVSYAMTYGLKSLPMDKTDFFSTHIVLCEETSNELIPILTYKSTNYQICNDYDIEFPALSLMKSDGHPSCVQKINDILNSLADHSAISFDSSWAQNIEYRFSNNKDLKELFKEITMMFAVKHHGDFNIPHMMTCGVLKVKTDLFFEQIGLLPLNEFSLFKQKNIGNEDVKIFYHNQFSSLAHQMSEKHSKLWDDKLVLADTQKRIKKAA